MVNRASDELPEAVGLLADLNRLLREGLVQVDDAFEADVPRFQVTLSGREYLETSEPYETVRVHVRVTQIDDGSADHGA